MENYWKTSEKFENAKFLYSFLENYAKTLRFPIFPMFSNNFPIFLKVFQFFHCFQWFGRLRLANRMACQSGIVKTLKILEKLENSKANLKIIGKHWTNWKTAGFSRSPGQSLKKYKFSRHLPFISY